MQLNLKITTELKNKLLFEKERIEKELQLITKPSLDDDRAIIFNEIGSSEDENASEVEEYLDNMAIENTLEKQLKEIIEALAHIENKTYGKCENCGSEISIERLLAYPMAKTCTKC